jgi:hypothetical protein
MHRPGWRRVFNLWGTSVRPKLSTAARVRNGTPRPHPAAVMKMPTGIDGFDEVTDAGCPAGSRSATAFDGDLSQRARVLDALGDCGA